MVTEMGPSPHKAAAPELSFVRRMDEAFGRFVRKGDYAIWTGSRRAGEARYVLLERHPAGVVPVVKSGAPLLHRIPREVPHTIVHLFGFWHATDVDAVWISGDQGDAAYYSLMVGGAESRPAVDACLWICPKCGETLVRHEFATARQGFGAFLDFALEKVREFNREDALRTCRRCGAMHPRSYGFYPDADTDEESAARLTA
jgi:hypothetical protein